MKHCLEILVCTFQAIFIVALMVIFTPIVLPAIILLEKLDLIEKEQ